MWRSQYASSCRPGQTWKVTRAPRRRSRSASAVSARGRGRRCRRRARPGAGRGARPPRRRTRRCARSRPRRRRRPAPSRRALRHSAADCPPTAQKRPEGGGAEAAHRDAADRELARARAEPPRRVGDRLAQEHRAPRAVGAVVVVAVPAAVEEHDHRGGAPERGDGGEQRVRHHRLGPRTLRDEPGEGRRVVAAVEQDEQRPPPAAGRKHRDLAEAAAQKAAPERVADDPRAVRARIRRSSSDEPGCADRRDEDDDRAYAEPAAAAYCPSPSSSRAGATVAYASSRIPASSSGS